MLFEDKCEKALTDQAVTLTLDREIDLSTGDLILVCFRESCEVADQFEVELVWMDTNEGFIAMKLRLSSLANMANATLEIKYIYDVNSLSVPPVKAYHLTRLLESRSVSTKSHMSPIRIVPLGSFIFGGSLLYATVAAGMISYGLRRASNLHLQSLSVNRKSRRSWLGIKGR